MATVRGSEHPFLASGYTWELSFHEIGAHIFASDLRIPQYVTEPGGWIEWSFDANTQLYVRFIRRWQFCIDQYDCVEDIYGVYGRDKDEVYLTPLQLQHLIRWMYEDGVASEHVYHEPIRSAGNSYRN